MTAAHARYGQEMYLARSNARIAAANEELLAKLIDAALAVLHHDRTDGSDVDSYERATLRKKFAKILKIKT